LKAANIAINPNPDFLRQVGSIIPIWRKVIQHPVYMRLMPTHQFRKPDAIRSLTARLAKRHKLVVGKFMGWYLH
jgi:hypothetical protein